jgi:hypothetical protein
MEKGKRAGSRETAGATQWRPGGEAADLLENAGEVVPVIGAGVSAAAGLPGGGELLAALRAQLDPTPNGPAPEDEDFFSAVDRLVDRDIDREGEAQICTADFYKEALAGLQVGAIVFYLVQVPSRLIVTLNYDSSLEAAAAEIDLRVTSLYGDKGIRRFTELAASGEYPEQTTVLHLHGSVLEPQGLVLTQDSYGDLSGSNLENLFAALVGSHRICVIGSALREPHLLTSLQQVHAQQRGKKFHPLFSADTDHFIAEFPGLETRAGLRRFELPTPEHIHGLASFLSPNAKLPGRLLVLEPIGNPLLETPGPHADDTNSSAVAAMATEQASGAYVANVLLEETEDSEEERSRKIAQSIVNAGRRRPPYPDADGRIWTEEQLAGSPRNLVIGAPGSGKTELMGEVARLLGPNQRALVIPLRTVSPAAADAKTRLSRWAALGANEREPPSPLELEEGSIHFLLDGLDEVAIPNQDQIATMIDDLARAFPRHSFTVTTRPIPALGTFEPGTWSRLELNPGATWRERYLRSRGGPSFADLLSAIDDGSELVELLELPFFLVRVVEMYEHGRLHGIDLWGCLAELVGQALAREESDDRLPLDTDHARVWLQDAALAMGLAGRTSASVAELAEIVLDPRVSAIPTEIAEGLIQRSMLRRSGDEYSFTHRIIGEFLAAEALLRLGPRGDLLRAIVPVRNELVYGIRSDWRVSVSFAMLASEEWREAIKPRDPLGWARAVPAGAGRSDRQDAALLLWRTYRKWKIWLWEREEPDLLQGVASLSRHLAAGDLPEVIEEIREGLDDSSAQVQGNAVRVLSQRGLAVESLEDDLRRILSDDFREAVVRRQAAAMAGELGLHKLLPAIISRAKATGPRREDVEGQTCAYAITDLARDEDELIAAATELLNVKEARFVLMLRVEERATPQKRLRFLRGYAAAEQDAYTTEKERLLDVIEDLGPLASTQIEEIAEIVGIWELSAEELGGAFDADKVAAVRGLGIGVEKAGGEWWRVAGVLHLFTPQELEAGGAPGEIVERRRFQIANAGVHPPVERPRRQSRPEQAPSLGALLTDPSQTSNLNIMTNAHYFSREAKDLDPEAKGELRRRLESWWEGPILEAITAEGPNSWTMQHWASAWLWLAPAVSAPLDDERWSELALAEPLYDEQVGWLKAHANEGSVRRALAREIGPRAQSWKQLLEAADGHAENELVEALVRGLDPGPEESSYVVEIARRLAEGHKVDSLRELARQNPHLGAELRPFLAHGGDATAIELMLGDFVAKLREGSHIDRGFQWLVGIEESRFLADLFEALSLASRGRTSPPDGLWELETALHETIRRIGGDVAIRGYDELLNDEEQRFFRLRREVIVAQELSAEGLRALEAAARNAGVPVLPVERPG